MFEAVTSAADMGPTGDAKCHAACASADAEAMDLTQRSSKKHKRVCAESGTALWARQAESLLVSTPASADSLCRYAAMHTPPDMSFIVALVTKSELCHYPTM